MNLSNHLATTTLAVLLGAGAALAPAQDQATTLWHGCQRAELVVRAEVVAATDPSPEWRRLEFRTLETLRGVAAPNFTLQEPGGACCGRSLFALEPGMRCLLFLQRTGAVLHPFGGERFVLLDRPELAAHVASLLSATTPAALGALLVDALAAADPRIAADAAHTLAQRPDLRLGVGHLQTVQEAFAVAMTQRASHAASLLEVLAQRPSSAVLDDLLPRYLAERRDDRARLLRAALWRMPTGDLLQRLPLHDRDDEQYGVRCAELFAGLPPFEATGALRGLIGRTRHPRVQLSAAEALLDLGAAPQTLRHELPPAVLDLAQQRRAASPHFRALPTPRR